MYNDPEGLMPSVKGVAYQVCVKTRYCGHLYSSLLRKWTWVGHRVYKSPYGESGEYTSPSLILTCAHTYKPLLPKSSPYYKGETHLLYAALYAAQHLRVCASIRRHQQATLMQSKPHKWWGVLYHCMSSNHQSCADWSHVKE